MPKTVAKRAKKFMGKMQYNWKSGLTVSLVAIPLSISLAVAAGASPTQGIITAIWAGLIAGMLGGSNYNIVGPTGALAGLLATFAFAQGAAALPILAMISGLMILAAWFFKLERYLIFIPANTVQGFTLGVAFIIAFNQFNFAFGLSGLPSHESFIENLGESFMHLGNTSPVALLTFVVFFAMILSVNALWKFIPKVPKIPPAAVVAPIGILLGYLSVQGIIPLGLQTLGSKYADLSPQFFLPVTWQVDLNQSLFITAGTVALIAILETMLSAKIADGMTKTKHDKRKEMLALGLANIASGVAGGIPATAALARTALNVKSGATHKSSAALSAVFVGVISLFLLPYFTFIPLPVIAAILANVAYRMVEHEHFVRMWRIDRKSFILAMIVAVITIVEDPIVGILVGAALSLLVFLDTLSRGQFDLVINDINKHVVGMMSGHRINQITDNSHTLVYSIKGHLTYVDSQAHITRFEMDLNGYENVVLRLRELYFVDLDGIDAFDEIVEMIEKKRKKVYVTGANDLILHYLRQSHTFTRLESEDRVLPHTADAPKLLGFDLNVKRVYR